MAETAGESVAQSSFLEKQSTQQSPSARLRGSGQAPSLQHAPIHAGAPPSAGTAAPPDLLTAENGQVHWPVPGSWTTATDQNSSILEGLMRSYSAARRAGEQRKRKSKQKK